jgi:hypothetical protein
VSVNFLRLDYMKEAAVTRSEIVTFLIERETPNARLRPYVDRGLFEVDHQREIGNMEALLAAVTERADAPGPAVEVGQKAAEDTPKR